jgi:pimeloyl-ACP methyl ester carboxylesterase
VVSADVFLQSRRAGGPSSKPKPTSGGSGRAARSQQASWEENNMTLGYETFGEGDRKVVVLHGWFGDETFMHPLRNALSPDEFTYVFPACRGYGASRRLAGDYTLEEISSDVLALADQMGLGRFSLVGHSMGGKFMQRVAVDAPGRVVKMVGVTPVPAAPVPFDEQGWALFDGAAASLDNRRAIIDFTTGSRHSKAWIDAMARRSEATSTREAFAAYLPAWAKTDFHGAVAGSRTPVKVIVGEHDPAITAGAIQATFLQWYANAELEIIPNAGHYPMDETPVALATTIEAYLRG